MYKLYKAKRNAQLHYEINIGGVIHNHCIALHKRYYRMYGKCLSPHYLKVHIAKLKKLPKYAWWSVLGSQAIQDIIERIDRGYQRFFQYLQDRKAHETRAIPWSTGRRRRHAGVQPHLAGHRLFR
jgi:putative transposase